LYLNSVTSGIGRYDGARGQPKCCFDRDLADQRLQALAQIVGRCRVEAVIDLARIDQVGARGNVMMHPIDIGRALRR
jgi:hypothetical protein